MDIFGILTMIGGLALFLYGMNAMGDGLARLSGGKMEQVLEKLTSRRIMAVLLGAGVTAVIQSSSGNYEIKSGRGDYHGCQYWYNGNFMAAFAYRD